MKAIGLTFGVELEAAGLLGLPFSWGSDGTFQWDERMTQEQINGVMAVYEAHDPTATLPPPNNPLIDLITALVNNNILPNTDLPQSLRMKT